ncbi:hypothetical protein EV363DRAFT_1159979, partial [Boletus edulis]
RATYRDWFDFILAFSGSLTIGHQIRKTFLKAIKHAAIDKTGDLWDVLSQDVCQDLHLLQMNSIVVLFKECYGLNSMPTAREISLHYLPNRLWGISFSTYGKESCNLTSHDFDMQSSSSGV